MVLLEDDYKVNRVEVVNKNDNLSVFDIRNN